MPWTGGLALLGLSCVTSVTLLLFYGRWLWHLLGRQLGRSLVAKKPGKRAELLSSLAKREGPTSRGHPSDWQGIIGFFHPFANAGGGGERVLWQAVRATQCALPRAQCVVYTSDTDFDRFGLIEHVETRFNIRLKAEQLQLLYLSTRSWVEAENYRHLTLLGQSLGSLVTAVDALALCVPDVFVDSMGFAFATALVGWLFPGVTKTVAYVHYPTISADMLDSLKDDALVQRRLGSRGLNAGQGSGIRGLAKKVYWEAFARLYGMMGASIDLVWANSSWTKAHLVALWGPARKRRERMQGTAPGWTAEVKRLYPPCQVKSSLNAVQLDGSGEKDRRPHIVCLAQFRPEKNHKLLLRFFALLVRRLQGTADGGERFDSLLKELRLVLIGSVRGDADATRVYELRLLVNELGIKDCVDFVIDAPWGLVEDQLCRCSIGVNTMWNEHFGIGVVEYMAAGLIPVVHDSGGPKLDIVGPESAQGRVGLVARTEEEFTDACLAVLEMEQEERVAMRQRARERSLYFSEEIFEHGWAEGMTRLVGSPGGE